MPTRRKTNKLIDILEEHEQGFSEFQNTIVSKLRSLLMLINNNPLLNDKNTDKEYGFVHDLKYKLEESNSLHITKEEMLKCNKLWKKYYLPNII
jgi:hypothetical protein